MNSSEQKGFYLVESGGVSAEEYLWHADSFQIAETGGGDTAE